MSNSRSDEPKLLPGCWLESPWDPGTAGPISEQSHLIDLIPLYKAQWLRYFIFWAIIVGGTLALGVLVPPMLNAMNIPVPDLIVLGKTGLDRWLETVLLLLTAGTSYLAWRIRRQKPECLTRGWILFFCVGIFLYMSLDRTSHCAQSLTNSINTILHNSLETNSVTLSPDNLPYWETAVYGIIYLAILSRLMIEFSGASMAQLFLLAATAAYACSCGLLFAPDNLIKLPLTIDELSGGLTLAGDFFLFWSLINYARFILLDGFGLDSEGWRIAINRYRYASRHSSRRSSYMQTEMESGNNYSSYSTESPSDNDIARENSPFAADDSGSQSQTVGSNLSSPFAQTISSVATTGVQTPENAFNPQTTSGYEQPFNSPFAQQPYGQQSYPQQPYSQPPYGQPQSGGQTSYSPQVPYSQTPYGQPPYNQASYDIQQNQAYGQNSYPPPQFPQSMPGSTASNSSAPGQSSQTPASTSTTPTAQEVQREFKKLEEKVHRQLTYDEKKAVVRRMIRERQGK